MRRSRKRGITIVETVVAMAVITIVSITAIGTIQRGLDYTNRAVYCEDARRDAANALECFKYAADEEAFLAALPRDRLTVEDGGADRARYLYRYGVLFTTEILVQWDDGELRADCRDRSGRRVFGFSYTKG